jgi:histidine triad (HIT) family protein
MDNCIFCKIINGEIPTNKIYEDEYVLAFKDLNPQMPVHVLIVPKKHIDSIATLNEKDEIIVGKIFTAINKIAKELNIAQNGFRVISNSGEDAGQTVKHLHFHLLAGKKMGENII